MPVNHQFETTEFSNLTKCFVCDEFIKNVLLTGVLDHTPEFIKKRLPDAVEDNLVPKGSGCTCKTCGVNVHDSCRDKVRAQCTRVSHKFELRSFPPFSKMCGACGTTLYGLYNQGYRCTECGLDVHPGCRTNVTVKICEGASVQVQEDQWRETEEVDAKTIQVAEFNEDEKKESTWRRSLSDTVKRLTVGKKTNPKMVKSFDVPVDIIDIGKELGKTHIQNRAVHATAAEKWEKGELPALKVSKKNLYTHKKKLVKLRGKLSKKADRLAISRTTYYHKLVSSLLAEYGEARQFDKKKKLTKSELADIEETTMKLLEEYSKHQCKELEMLEHLQNMLPVESHSSIQAEIHDGPHVDKELEKTLALVQNLHHQVSLATSNLEAVRREIFFPKWHHWFLRLGMEGTYVAIGHMWLELVRGAVTARVAMLPQGKSMVPTVIIRLTGYDNDINMSDLGGNKKASKTKQSGTKLICRVEQLSISARALGFTLDQLSLNLEYFLNIEMQYIASKRHNSLGSWRLKPDSFVLHFQKFELNFKSGTLHVPDTVLRTVVKKLIATGAKAAIKAALSPELGHYFATVAKTMPETLNDSSDILNFHGKFHVEGETDLSTLDVEMTGATKKKKTLNEAVKKKVVNALKGKRRSRRRDDIKPFQRVGRVLGLDSKQIDLFIRTQQMMGLSKDTLFPDDSLRELGMKALYAAAHDMAGSVSAVNRIGMKALAGELLSSSAPLVTLLDIVNYILLYFGPNVPRTVFTDKSIVLWQAALDGTRKSLLSSPSFKSSTSGASNRSIDIHGGGESIVGRIVFQDLIDRILQVSRKKLIVEVGFEQVDLSIGLVNLLEVSKAALLKTAEKSNGKSAMVVQLRETTTNDTMHGDDEEAADDEDTFNFHQDLNFKQSSMSFHTKQTTIIDDDEELEYMMQSATFVPSESIEKQKKEQIQRNHEKKAKQLEFIRSSLIQDFDCDISGSIGNGSFDLDIKDLSLLSPVNFEYFLKSSIFANQGSRKNFWPWRRMAKNENGCIRVAMVRQVGEAFTDPDSKNCLDILSSGIDSHLETRDGQPGKIHFNLKPSASLNSTWTDAGNLMFEGKAETDTFWRGIIENLHVHGDLDFTKVYFMDLLEWVSLTVRDKRREKITKAILSHLIKYAQMNTFFGALAAHIALVNTQEDLFLRIAKPRAKKGVSMEIQVNFEDFIDDVHRLLTIMTPNHT